MSAGIVDLGAQMQIDDLKFVSGAFRFSDEPGSVLRMPANPDQRYGIALVIFRADSSDTHQVRVNGGSAGTGGRAGRFDGVAGSNSRGMIELSVTAG